MLILKEYLPNVIASVLILALGLPFSKILNKTLIRVLEKFKLDKAVSEIISSVLNAVLLFIVIILAVSKLLNIEIGSLMASLGAIFVAFSIVLKDVLANAISGTAILGNKLFTIGDIIEIGSITGEVIKINLFSTKILTSGKKTVNIPNFRLVNENVISYSKDTEVTFEQDYTLSNVAELKKFIEYFNGSSKISDKVSKVKICSCQDNSLKFKVVSRCSFEQYKAEKERIQKCFEILVLSGFGEGKSEPNT